MLRRVPLVQTIRRLSSSIRMSSSSNSSRDEASHGFQISSDLLPLASMMEAGISPKILLQHLAPTCPIPAGADDMMLWRLLFSMIEPPKRKKLPQHNTIDDAVDLIKRSEKIVVLSGAGISTSAGLPDFRSRNGIYVQIHAEHPDLQDPKCMFDIEYFRTNPRPFYQFAKALFPGQFRPTVGHMFIKRIEDHCKLLRNYTQNIDTLEKQAGIKQVVECHGSFSKATCTSCKYSVDGEAIRNDIFEQKVPLCPKCLELEDGPSDGLGIMKPNIVFFGEQLGDEFHSALEKDKEEVDLLIVIGSSLKVRPVALIPRTIRSNVPQILINREPLEHMGFDIELLGDCDGIIQELCLRLGDSWNSICGPKASPLIQVEDLSANSILRSFLDVANITQVNCDALPDRGQSNQGEEDPAEVPVKNNDNETSGDDTREDTEDEMTSFKSNQANLSADDERAISENNEGDNGDDDNWEDVELIDSSMDSSDSEVHDKIEVKLPPPTYLYIKPNTYIFQGAELTKVQLSALTKEP